MFRVSKPFGEFERIERDTHTRCAVAMPVSRRKAKRQAREARKKSSMEGGGDEGEGVMSDFILNGAVRNSMLVQNFMQLVPMLCAAVLCQGLYHTFEQGYYAGGDANSSARGDRGEYALAVRVFSFFSALEAVLIWWCMRAPQERGGVWRGAGVLAAAEIVCGLVLGIRFGVPFDHSFPLGAVLYSVVFIFWMMASQNALKYDHAQMKFKLMQEENFAKGNR